VEVLDGEETPLAFNMKSDGLSATGYHHRRPKKQPPSTLARFGDSIKSFFSGGAASATSKSQQK
jgi:hypothetical protein